MDYLQFLESKRVRAPQFGIEVSTDAIHPMLFPFQRDITRWAIRKGRAAVFLDTGLGKTYIQLEWARLLGKRTLIIAPLSVARQTVRLAQNISLTVPYVRSQSDLDSEHLIFITNYEMLEHFNADYFGAVALDESSILKALDGKTKRRLISMFKNTPYKSCYTATPAPNDQSEIGNHSEFLGILTMAEMLAMFFVHDEQDWRLKGHGRQAFYQWLASWAISIRKPSDLGYEDDGYILPPLSIKPVFVKSNYRPEGQLFFTGLKGIQDRTKIRKSTLGERVQAAIDLVNGNDDQWIIWCGLNDESNQMAKGIKGAVNVQGSDSLDSKIFNIEAFQDGKYKALVTKGKIAGFGMNFQQCHNMIFVGLNDSWESYYQCIRRCYRFGQTQPVNVYIVLSEIEQEIYQNVQRKEQEASHMSDELISNMRDYEQEELNRATRARQYTTVPMTLPQWMVTNGI